MPVQETFWDYFWFARYFLRAAGILPLGGTPSLWKSSLTEFLAALPLLYGLYYVIPEMNYILFQSHDTDDLLEAVIVVIIVLGGQIRSIFVAINRRKITRLFAICGTLWDHVILADYKVISIWAKRARLFSTIYFCAAQFAITTFVLAATVKQLSSPANSTMRYFPFQSKQEFIPSPQYEIKYTLQVIIGYVGISFVAAADMTGTLLALNTCGQLALIRSWLLNISKEEFTTTRGNIDESPEVTLKKCICRHQVVMDFCAELEEVVRYINLAQIITGMYVLAISAARLTEVKMYHRIELRHMNAGLEYRYFGPLLLSISGLFFSCWPADNLSFASSEVAQAVYEVPWYSFSPSGKTAVAIMLMRSQRPAKLTAGKFVALSLETFSSIVSSSMSFCMLLHSF